MACSTIENNKGDLITVLIDTPDLDLEDTAMVTLLVEAHASLEEKRGPTNLYTRRALDHVIDLYEAWGQPNKAAQYRAKRAQQ